MKIIIEGPSFMEGDVEIVDGKLVITPTFMTGSSTTLVAYLRAEGEGGMSATAMLSFNGRRSAKHFQVTHVVKPARKADFDLPPEEFAKKLKKKKAKEKELPSEPIHPDVR